MSIKQVTMEMQSTQNITFLPPNKSESQPPMARIKPEGKLNAVANRPAVTSGA
jgi:hypothetical protein